MTSSELRNTANVILVLKDNSAKLPVSLMTVLLATCVSRNLMPINLTSKRKPMLAPSVTTAQKVLNHQSSVPLELLLIQLPLSRRVSAQCVSLASIATTTAEFLKAALRVLTAPWLVSNLPTALREPSNQLPTRVVLMTVDSVSVVTTATGQVSEISLEMRSCIGVLTVTIAL